MTHRRINCLRIDQETNLLNLAINANLGVLGIESQTRRRNRLNGVVSKVDRFTILEFVNV